MESELKFSRDNLQSTVEELETSNEELQATNEELLASNEELQSTNEELQSVNEELYTVNSEYQGKISELTTLNTDMDNLFNTTDTVALFVDENLKIRTFTPKLMELFPIVSSDVGRPISHFSLNVGEGNDLHQMANHVRETAQGQDFEYLASDNRWRKVKVNPYIISDRIISGVVIIISDIHELKTAKQLVLQNTEHVNSDLISFNETAPHLMVICDESGNVTFCNQRARMLLKVAVGDNLSEALPESFSNEISQALKQASSTDEPVELDLHAKQDAVLPVDLRLEFKANTIDEASTSVFVQEVHRLSEARLSASNLTALLDISYPDRAAIVVERGQVVGVNKQLDAECARTMIGKLVNEFTRERYDTLSDNMKVQLMLDEKPMAMRLSAIDLTTQDFLLVEEL